MKEKRSLFELAPIPNYIYNKKGYTELAQHRKNKLRLRLMLSVIVGVPLIAILTTTFLVRLYHVDGSSMEPTLNDGERVLIEKWDKTKASFSGDEYVLRRYDIVVLKPPGGGKQVIKRIIGVPGDRILVIGGDVAVINDEHPEGYQVDREVPGDALRLVRETQGDVDVLVGEGEYFVLGDNRPISEDSRDFGSIPSKDIVGKLWKRI